MISHYDSDVTTTSSGLLDASPRPETIWCHIPRDPPAKGDQLTADDGQVCGAVQASDGRTSRLRWGEIIPVDRRGHTKFLMFSTRV